MVKPTPKERVGHILEAIRFIKAFTSGISEEAFYQDVQTQSAVKFQFLIIGEAIRHIDMDILEKYEYPWHIPRTFRNFIIHDYHRIKLERIYNASLDLDELENLMNFILINDF